MTWLDEDGNPFPYNEKFVAGKDYTIRVALTADFGYCFPENGMINDYVATVEFDDPTHVTLVDRFTCAEAGYFVGDVNKDKSVTNRDAVILDRYIAGWIGYDKEILSMDAADIDRNGEVPNRDAVLLDRYIAGWMGYDAYIIPLA